MRSPAENFDDLIDAAAAGIEPERRELFVEFSGRLLTGVETHHAGGLSVLGTLALDAFAFAERRQPGAVEVRVHDPRDRSGHSVVEILQDDRAFIVDSVRLVLARFGLEARTTLHPIYAAERDAEGRLLRVSTPTDGEHRESYVYMEVAPALPESERDAFVAALEQVVGWVRDVTDDHRRMIRAVRELVVNLEYAGPNLPGGVERAAKVRRFLDFLADGRFVFVGMRRYRLDEVDGELEAQIVPGTGLGMWRDDDSSRLALARRGEDIPEEIRDDALDERIILISKSRMESRVHRHGRLDRLVVKEHDGQGRLTGFTIAVGLFTLRLLRTPGSQIPLLSERLQDVLGRLDLSHGSHDHKALVAAFDSAPVEVLIGADVDALVDLLQELVEAAGAKHARLLLRTHPRGRTLYAAVLLPREHYREDLRAGVRHLLERLAGASYIDDRINFVDEGTAVIHCFCTCAEGQQLAPDADALEAEIRMLCSPWEDQLLDALRERNGGANAPELAARYETAFPSEMRARTHPHDAVRDVEALERLHETGVPQFSLYFDHGDTERSTATLRIYLAEAPLLSDVMGITDHFGLRVVDAQLAHIEPRGRTQVAVESLRILPLGANQTDLDAVAGRLSDALAAALTGVATSDELNGLVLGAGLDWRQVDCIRACLEYLLQLQTVLSRPFLRSVLLDNPLAVRVLIQLLESRHDPELLDAEREAVGARLRTSFEAYRDRITSLNEDRALSGFLELIEATLRINTFAPSPTPHRVVFKLDPSRLSSVSGVVPHREIFVWSAKMMGIHLRGGPVARGGLRFSDRHDDLRVEILGLMSTQMLKNGLIVPVGAKGGFVLRESGLSPSEARAQADEQYRIFISSLLDVTDNLAPDGEVLGPEGVQRLDGDDPYLVVAADKGTAHLSDTANEIAVGRDFWLGDAFASGGSEGYDHKKYAITARGAWECVKHHFSELGIDPEQDDYTVVGIGDMSGDVFGNGLLLARRARLLAAFDHRHVFLDPDPDPEAAFRERQRLFDLPRSSWADYDPAVLSEGGCVQPRSAKRIPVPPAMAERLGIRAEAVSGPELVKAILGMPVDLLWNGGIGTYVKAGSETHADAGDRANDAVRIDASALRARVVGEGGNLGLTQAARVEAALLGVRLNTDAIDNSAGVDLSDHEVNYKVALAPAIRSGRLAAEARRELLFSVADEACEAVLAHNRSQALALSLDERRSLREPDAFLLASDLLCSAAGLDPLDLGLPDAAALSERAGQGTGFTRPELAVLLGLAKLQALSELGQSELPRLAYLEPEFRGYFPERFQQEQAAELGGHRLRDEITALRLVNRLIDAGGATTLTSLTSELGVGLGEAAAALLQAEDLLRIPGYRLQLLKGVGESREGVYGALIELDAGVHEVARYLVRIGTETLEAGRVDALRKQIDLLRGSMRDYLSPGEAQRLDARTQRLEEQGLAADLAYEVAGLPLADRGLNILRICARFEAVPPLDAARAYAALGDQSGINWLYGRLSQTPAHSLWDRMLLADVRWDLLDLQREITEGVLAAGGDDLEGAVVRFLEDHATEIDRVQALERRSAAEATPGALAVIAARLRCLASGSGGD
ncbi:MAG: NAD-glutamate dehydrogenase [Myxococcota bacterium]|nr:NAD-glutamate dehydrogenase [Myxococcota bacterium]